jgi:small subunit ribosomal protein S17
MSERPEETVTDETTPDATLGEPAVSANPARRAPEGSAGDRTRRKVRVGVVVSDKMDKTVVVSVERLRRHPIYKRVVRLSSKFKAHDEDNAAHVGDTVRIEESRPLSAEKRWKVVEIVARGSHEELVG